MVTRVTSTVLTTFYSGSTLPQEKRWNGLTQKLKFKMKQCAFEICTTTFIDLRFDSCGNEVKDHPKIPDDITHTTPKMQNFQR